MWVDFGYTFKKQPKEITPEQQASDDINDILSGAIKSDKVLKKFEFAFWAQLNDLLEMGKKGNYKGRFNYIDKESEQKNITYNDVDETMGIPTLINIWLNGKIKSVYEILSAEPEMDYVLTDINNDFETQYKFTGTQNQGDVRTYKNDIVIKQFRSSNGLYQQQLKKINEEEGFLCYELYWNQKEPEKSHFLHYGENGAILYGYDKKNKFWYEKGIISTQKDPNEPALGD